MSQVRLKTIFVLKIQTEGIQNSSVGIDHFIALPADEMDMRTMFKGGINDLAFTEIIAAGKSFLPEKVQSPINSSDIDHLRVFLQQVSDLFGGDMVWTVGNCMNDHLPLGSDPETALSQLIQDSMAVCHNIIYCDYLQLIIL